MREHSEDDDVRVCHDCIGEAVLKAEILKEGQRGGCAFCPNEDQPSVLIGNLARRVDNVFRELVGIGPDEIRVHGEHVDYGPSGESPSFLMNEMIEAADDGVGRAIVARLSARHDWDVNDGDFDWYDETSEIYTITGRGDGRLRERWTEFCSQLKQDRRFFLRDGIEVLDQILTPLLDGRWPDGGAIRTIGPDDVDCFIFRGRLANDESASAQILRQRISQLGAARPGRAGPGRMNPAGVSVFYGAFDALTCVAELRVPVGGSAIIGRFEILRPLRVLDLTRLEAASRRHLSYFEAGYSELLGYSDFVSSFHEEVRRAIIPGRETLDYLPTQIVAEYLWARADPPFDGLIFGSSQITETQNNIALFPHAAAVEGAEDERERSINFVYTTCDEDGDNPEERVLFDPLREDAVPTSRKARATSDDDWFGSVDSGKDKNAPGPALRLNADGVRRHRVRAISYETDPEVPITFSDYQDRRF